MLKLFQIFTLAVLTASVAAAQSSIPDLRGTWKGESGTVVVGAGNTHHPAAAEEPEFRSVGFTLTIDKQEGRRLSGIFSSARGSYRVVAVISRTGTIFLADVEVLFQRDNAGVGSHGALLSKTYAGSARCILHGTGGNSHRLFALTTARTTAAEPSVNRAGSERILAFLGTGAIVGELSFIDGLPRSASVVAVRPAQLSFLSRAAFEEFTNKNPEVYRSLLTLTATRLRETDSTVAAGSFLPLRGRVACTLLELAQGFGQDVGAGRIVIRQKIGQSDLAAMPGLPVKTSVGSSTIEAS